MKFIIEMKLTDLKQKKKPVYRHYADGGEKRTEEDEN